MPATALDLPAELIRRIADDIVSSSVVGLVAVGETHNLWPVIFRSYIFFEISLCSYAEVAEFTSLLEAPGSDIRNFVEVVRVVHQDWSVPWLHHISAFTEKLPNFSWVTLNFERPPFGTSIRSLTTLHPLLPSSIPAHYSNFASLTLAEHEFNDFSELIRLVRGLPALKDLTCSTLTWKERTPVQDRQRGLYFFANLRDVSTVASQEESPMLWLLTTNKKAHSAPSSPVVSVPEIAKIIDIISVLLKCGRTRDQPQAYLQFATSIHSVPPTGSSIPDLYAHPLYWQVVFRSTLTGPAFLARFIFVLATPFAYVQHICLDIKLSKDASDAPSMFQSALSDELVQNPLNDLEKFPARTAKEELLAVEWAGLDTLFADMFGLRKVDAEVDLSEKVLKEEFAILTGTIQGRMARMCEANKLDIRGTQFRPKKTQDGPQT